MTPEEREKMMKDLDARRKEAEAKLRTVEYRIYYGDYKSVGGVQFPARLSRRAPSTASRPKKWSSTPSR